MHIYIYIYIYICLYVYIMFPKGAREIKVIVVEKGPVDFSSNREEAVCISQSMNPIILLPAKSK